MLLAEVMAGEDSNSDRDVARPGAPPHAYDDRHWKR
jgi:hypothetical protein